MRRRLVSLRSENSKLQRKIEEIKLVDRAKWALIQYLHMNEQQAHRYIEKQAMDLRQSRRDVAERIIKTYEQGR
ncbi:MAG: ANTAR domain-containing protein, partial [Sphaerochaetaceae bacterium]